MKDEKTIYKIAERMMKADKKLRQSQEAYERMSRLEYELPGELGNFDWIRPMITTAPYDALRGATRSLSNLDERVNVHPVTVLQKGEAISSKAVRERANMWEKVLKWEGDLAGRRRGMMRSDIVYSSCLYHEVVGQIVSVDVQNKAKGITGTRFEAAKRFGNWAIRLRDPKTVHVEYSDYMPERVLSVNMRTAQELVDFWGNKKLEREIKSKPDYAVETFIEFDYVDYDVRFVWAVQSNTESDALNSMEGGRSDGCVVLFEPKPWLMDKDGKPVPFLPWICVAGGTSLDPKKEHQRKPIFYPVYRAEMWANANIMNTLRMSEALATMGEPTQVITGPNSEDVEVDYDAPGGRVNLTQFQSYQQLQKHGLDPKLSESFMSIEDAIKRATVAEILVSGRPMQGTQAYASYNLEVQQAVASLGDYKDLSERFFDSMYESMLLVAHYTGTDLYGYGDGVDEYKIDSEDIDPKRIYLNTELNVDVPADRMQRVTAATQLVSAMPYSPQRAIEMLGDTDPEGALEDYKLWQLEINDFQAKLERMRMEASGQYEQDVMMAAQQIVEQQMQQMQQQAPQEAGMGMPPSMPQGPEGGMPGVGGQMFNPAQGGMPPAMASPNMNTFEQQNGATRGGNPMTEVLG